MQYRMLGQGEQAIRVSLIGLGTMTWGEQNTEAEAWLQLDYALAEGVNFIDTAELYSIPPRAATYGSTETFIGRWLKRRGRRDDLVIASKVAGPAEMVRHIRGGARLSRKQVLQALDESLARLQTDYLDLYQVHWPERNTNYFGRLGFEPRDEPTDVVPIEETLSALDEAVRAGKVRAIGISNESPWGLYQYLLLAERHGWPRVVSVQNPYSLLNRSYEIGLAEFAHREGVGLLAYSPLGFGVLTGKYLRGRPEGARLTRFPAYRRYSNPQAEAATQLYCALAAQHGLSPAQLALAFVNSRPFVISNLIGATTLEQLKENIESVRVRLAPEVLQAIAAVHAEHPNPAP